MARSDHELVMACSHDAGAFGELYRRHEDRILRYFLRRVRDVEAAADLTAETFAAALASAHRFEPGPAPVEAWLFGIARNVLALSVRRGRVEDAARRRLEMEPVVLRDDVLDQLKLLQDEARAVPELAELPADQRHAVEARVLREREYRDIAHELGCSEQVVRQRVSRGIRTLRRRLEKGRS